MMDQSDRGSNDVYEEKILTLRRSKRTIVRLVCYRDEDNVNIYHCFFSKPIDDLKSTCSNKANGVKANGIIRKVQVDGMRDSLLLINCLKIDLGLC